MRYTRNASRLRPKVRAFGDFLVECFGPEPCRDQALRAAKSAEQKPERRTARKR